MKPKNGIKSRFQRAAANTNPFITGPHKEGEQASVIGARHAEADDGFVDFRDPCPEIRTERPRN